MESTPSIDNQMSSYKNFGRIAPSRREEMWVENEMASHQFLEVPLGTKCGLKQTYSLLTFRP